MKSSCLGVDVTDFQFKGLTEAQATGVNEGEGGVETRFSESGEKLRYFLRRDDDGESLAVLDFKIAKDLPDGIELEVFVIEGAQGNPGLIHGAGGVVLLLAKEEEIGADLIGRDLVGIRVEMLGEESEVRDVAIDCSWSLVHELDKVAEVIESLAERIF